MGMYCTCSTEIFDSRCFFLIVVARKDLLTLFFQNCHSYLGQTTPQDLTDWGLLLIAAAPVSGGGAKNLRSAKLIIELLRDQAEKPQLQRLSSQSAGFSLWCPWTWTVASKKARKNCSELTGSKATEFVPNKVLVEQKNLSAAWIGSSASTVTLLFTSPLCVVTLSCLRGL